MLTSRSLAAALAARFPDRAGDPAFLRQVLVIEGIDQDYTPEYMTTRFADFGVVLSSEVVRDDIDRRAGVIVFNNDAACSAAAEAGPLPGSYRTATVATTLDVRNHRRSYRHLRNLIGVLSEVCPAATEDPEFLERSVLVEGVSPHTSPRVLQNTFQDSLPVQATVLVRDIEFGDRVGLLVLTDADHCTTATATAGNGCFCSCIQANQGGLNRLHILDALEDSARRRPNAEAFRSLLPPEYLRTDTAMDFHLRCVFLRGPGCSGAGGAYGLCCIGHEILLAPGQFSAVIIHRAQGIGVLVYDHAVTAERVATRAPLLHPHNLMMAESSLFPLPAAAGAVAASGARRLLPAFVTAANYAGRVVLLEIGLDEADNPDEAKICDAAEVAQFLEFQMEFQELEAVIVHGTPADTLLVLVLGSQDNAQALLQVPRETWFEAFQRPVVCHLLEATPRQWPPAPLQLQLSLNHWISPMAFEILRLQFSIGVAACHPQDFRGLTRQLVGLVALSQPHALRRGYFPERAVLLTAIAHDARESDLRTALTRYGSLDELLHVNYRRLALVVFTSWTGATRLLREPAATRLALGLGDCRPAPDAGFASVFVEYVLRYLLFYQSMVPPYI